MRASLPVTGSRHRTPGSRPHLTLSAARVEDVHPVAAVAEHVAARHQPFPLVLSELGTFARVVWLGPTRTRQLTVLHRAVWQAMIDAGWPPAFAGQSDPDTWVPHCTLIRGELAGPAQVSPVELTVSSLVTIVVGKGEAARIPLGR